MYCVSPGPDHILHLIASRVYSSSSLALALIDKGGVQASTGVSQKVIEGNGDKPDENTRACLCIFGMLSHVEGAWQWPELEHVEETTGRVIALGHNHRLQPRAKFRLALTLATYPWHPT